MGGDCVHNLRSSLDHVIYALAVKNTGQNPPPKAGSLYFPIFDSPEKYREKAGRLAPLSDRAKAFIESLQPYNSGNSHRSFILRALNEFDNSDKHRLLHVAASRMGSGEFKFEGPFCNLNPNIVVSTKPIEDGTELASFTLDPPKLNVEYKVTILIDITVNHVPAPNGSWVSPLISMLGELIQGVREILVLAQHC